jgi:hypothetical protein
MIISLLACLRNGNGINSLFFLWVCGWSFLIYIIGNKKKWAAVLIGLLAFLPIIFAKSLEFLSLETAAILCGVYIACKETAGIDYECEIDAFKRGFGICSGTFLLSILTSSINQFSNNSAQYVLIYFVSSIIILRTLRFVKYNRNNKDAERINKRYSAAMIVITAALSIQVVRNGIVSGIGFVYNLIVDIILKILYYFFMAVGNVMTKIMEALAKLIKPSQMPDFGKFGNYHIQNNKFKDEKSIIKVIYDNKIFSTVLKISIFLLIAYLVIKFLKTYFASRKDNGEYIEESEFIKKEKDKNGGYLNKLMNFLKPKNYIEYIRYYYQRFMKLSINKGIKIENNDTTKDINVKASSKYKGPSLEGLRDIYLRARYSDNECSKEDTKKVKDYYQSIAKQK